MTAFEQFGDEAARRVRLLASDLSTKILARAEAGIYKADRVAGMPRHLVLKYFERRPTLPQGTIQVAKRIRCLVEFRRLNLLNAPPAGRGLDFIFCRNALIFSIGDQQRVFSSDMAGAGTPFNRIPRA